MRKIFLLLQQNKNLKRCHCEPPNWRRGNLKGKRCTLHAIKDPCQPKNLLFIHDLCSHMSFGKLNE